MNLSRCFLALLVFTAASLAQSSDSLLIRVQPQMRAVELQVRYFLLGPFGGVSNFETSVASDGRVKIPTLYSGKRAKSLKAVLYLPGCEMQVVRFENLDVPPADVDFRCSPLPALHLRGSLDSSASQLQNNMAVKVWYLGPWENVFAGFYDALVSQIALANALIAYDGTFEIDIPNFSADPVNRGIGKNAYLSLLLVDAQTGNVIGILKPPKALTEADNHLRILDRYPSPLKFAIER